MDMADIKWSIQEIVSQWSEEVHQWKQVEGLGRIRAAKRLSDVSGRHCTAGVMGVVFKRLGLSPAGAAELELQRQSKQETTPDIVEEPIEETKWVHDTRYFYARESDTYITWLSRSNQPLRVPGETHRSMKAAYSNWDGDPASVNRICRDFSIPRAWFTEYKSIHGWTHDSEPFSDEELVERSEADLVADALQQRRRSVTKKFEKKRWKHVRDSAEKWMRFEIEVLEQLKASIAAHAPEYSVPRLRLPRSDRRFAVITSATDFHWGMHAWDAETGEAYNRKIAEQRLHDTTADLFSRLPGQPEELILAVGSDWFHVDGDVHATTRGTPQDTDTGSPAEIMITGCELARDHVNLLRQVAPVKIVLMAGNHDRANALGLLLYLAAWFRDDSDVTVISNFKPRVYLVYGETLMGFHHGDGTPVPKLGACMASEAREDWGKTKYHIFFGGHLHHEVVREVGGIKHFQMPSLAGTDRYHARKGYVDSQGGLACFICDHERGITAHLFSPVDK